MLRSVPDVDSPPLKNRLELSGDAAVEEAAAVVRCGVVVDHAVVVDVRGFAFRRVVAGDERAGEQVDDGALGVVEAAASEVSVARCGVVADDGAEVQRAPV